MLPNILVPGVNIEHRVYFAGRDARTTGLTIANLWPVLHVQRDERNRFEGLSCFVGRPASRLLLKFDREIEVLLLVAELEKVAAGDTVASGPDVGIGSTVELRATFSTAGSGKLGWR